MNFERSFNKALLEGDVEEIKRLSSCLYETYSRLAYQVAFSILGSEEGAKDAVSEAFVSFLGHLNDIGKIKNIKYYLLSSTRYISYRQKKKEEATLSYEEDSDFFLREERLSETLDAIALLALVKKVLTKEEITIVLSQKKKKKSCREHAFSLHQSPNAISGKYARAIDKIKKARKGTL